MLDRYKLIGKIYGRWTILEYDIEKSNKTHKLYFKCRCECGTIKSVEYSSLSSGNSKSCGCLNKEIVSQLNSKSNIIEYDAELNCYKGYFNNSDECFLFDVEDLDIVLLNLWTLDKNKGYVMTVIKGTNSTLYIHRAIMSKYYNINGSVVDHINHNKLDNRKCNLRICAQSENIRNSKSHSNTGYKFISYIKKNNYYRVKINNSVNKVEKYYRSLYDAVTFRDEWCKNNPDEYMYNLNNDNRIIHPFIIIDKEKYNRGINNEYNSINKG